MVLLLAVGYSDGELLGQQALVYRIRSAGVLEEGCMVVQLWLAIAEKVVAGDEELVYFVALSQW